MFKKFDGKVINDISAYVNGWLSDKDKCEIHIGTDSQVKNNSVIYVTVICMWEVGKGVHIIYEKEALPRSAKLVPFKAQDFKKRNPDKKFKPKQEDLFLRLWGEIERTKTVADIISSHLLRNMHKAPVSINVHLDINPDEKHGSNVAYQAGVGYFQGQEYDVFAKPDAWAASHAADMLCK
jgi:hypothetical protein